MDSERQICCCCVYRSTEFPVRESRCGAELEMQHLPAQLWQFLITNSISHPHPQGLCHPDGLQQLYFPSKEFLSNTTRWQWILFQEKLLTLLFYSWNKCPNCYPLTRDILINFNCKLTCKCIFLICSKMTTIQINCLYKFRNPLLLSSLIFVLFHRPLKIALILLGNTGWANSSRNNKVPLFTLGLHKRRKTGTSRL